jgi:hypothetical protein
MRALRTLIGAALAAFSLAGVGRADQIFMSQASFLAQVQPGYYLETFDTEGFRTFGGITTPYTFSADGFSYQAAVNSGLFTVQPTGGTLSLSNTLQSDPLIFNFTSNNVTAVGGNFFLTNTPGDVTTGAVKIDLNDGTSVSLTNADLTGFLGFTSLAPISSLTVTPTSGGDVYSTVDNLIVGAAVPEPGTLALGGCGLVSLAGWVVRRRSHGRAAVGSSVG